MVSSNTLSLPPPTSCSPPFISHHPSPPSPSPSPPPPPIPPHSLPQSISLLFPFSSHRPPTLLIFFLCSLPHTHLSPRPRLCRARPTAYPSALEILLVFFRPSSGSRLSMGERRQCGCVDFFLRPFPSSTGSLILLQIDSCLLLTTHIMRSPPFLPLKLFHGFSWLSPFTPLNPICEIQLSDEISPPFFSIKIFLFFPIFASS